MRKNNFRWLTPLRKGELGWREVNRGCPLSVWLEGRQYIGNVTAEVLASGCGAENTPIALLKLLPPVSGESAAEPTLEGGRGIEVVGSLPDRSTADSKKTMFRSMVAS